MAPRRCLALGHVAVPASGGALRLSLLHGPLEGQPPGPATPNTDTFNMIPCIFQAGSCPPWAMCPCAVSSSSGRPCAPMPKLQGQTGGHPSPTPCPVVVLKLQDNVNLVSLAQQGCCCCSEPPALPAEAATLSKGLRTWSRPHKMEGSTSRSRARCVCLMRDTEQFLPSPRLGCGGPKQEYILMAWFLFSILCWNSGSRL